MFGLTSQHRFYLCPGVTDMRKSFDGLGGLIQNELHRNATSGEVFIFVNRRRNRIKLLQWQPGGFVLYYKRLEEGTFELPAPNNGRIFWPELMMIIEGISLEKVKKRKRYLLEKSVD
jgi:transposase